MTSDASLPNESESAARSDATRGSLSSQHMDEFVRLLAAHQRRLFLYVSSLVPNPSEAEEVLQETNLVLWREFDRFRPGSNFAAWACKVALFQVLAWRKRRQRDRLNFDGFSESFLEAVGAEIAEHAETLDQRSAHLSDCVEKLSDRQRQMLQLRYSDGLDVGAIAARVGTTSEAVYRALSRIRGSLHECVSRSLAREEHA